MTKESHKWIVQTLQFHNELVKPTEMQWDNHICLFVFLSGTSGVSV